MTVVVRGLLVGVGVVLAMLAVRQQAGRVAETAAFLRELDATGMVRRQGDLARELVADPDPVRARLGLARALLAESFEFSAFSRLPQREAIEAVARVPERLETARRLAAAGLAARPAAWQGAMVLGGATYRLWALRGDGRLFTRRDEWSEPLRVAGRLAPAEDEPAHLLARVSLELWPTLAAADREAARALLRRAFVEPATFAALAELWIVAAGTLSAAEALVPPTAAAWATMQSAYERRRNWDGVTSAWLRRVGALERELSGRVDEVARRLQGGDRAGARAAALEVIGRAPADANFAPLVGRALALLPPGPVSAAHAPAFRRWLEWNNELFVRGRTALPPPSVQRLILGAGELPLAEAALAALAGGNLARAELLERRLEAVNTEPWGPYWLAKARVLAGRGAMAEAAAALARAHREWRGAVAGAEVRAAIRGDQDVDSGADPATFAASDWPATTWRWRGSVAWADLLADRDAPGLLVTIATAPTEGAAVRVAVDGATVAVAPALTGNTIPVATSLGSGAHLVQVETVAGGRVAPGHVRLLR
jgi:hypothetical protein